MNEILKKQRLHPVQAAWEVSPSTPYLRLSVAEGDLRTEVTFVGHFGLEHRELPDNSFSLEVPVIRSEADIEARLNVGATGEPYQLVRVIFQDGAWSRFSPAYSDREVIKEDDYDWSEILFPGIARNDIEGFREAFWSRWRKTCICPIPGMYEVKNSRWLDSLHGEYRRYNHYLITGHDAYVEVLAASWRWESLGGLCGW